MKCHTGIVAALVAICGFFSIVSCTSELRASKAYSPRDFAASESTATPSNNLEYVSLEAIITEIQIWNSSEPLDSIYKDALRSELVSQLSERAAEYGGRIPAAAPVGDAGRVTDLEYDPETNLLSWSYVNKGDYDLSGDVGIPDITPIALNYLKLVEYDEDGNPAGDIETIDGYENHRLAWIDGDKSGEIGIPDITTIALNYLSDVLGYRLFRSPDGEGDWEEFGSFVNYGVRGDFPKVLSVEITSVESVFVSVRPVGAGSTLGEFSNVIRIDPAWNLASVALAGTSSGAGTVSNPYVLMPNSSYPIIVMDSNSNDVSLVCDYDPEFNYYRIVDTRYIGTLEFGPLSKVTVSRQGDPVSLEFWVKVWQ